ncbi:MAG TPA: hypothetical protein VGV16_09040 [Gammaproteobacteria bacterium]|nr:hypothetical protein [Gammaproteobacteria bacterium]
MVQAGPHTSADGIVFFKLAGQQLPKWPQECVVCNKYCAETRELRCALSTQRSGASQPFFAKSPYVFAVPVHVSDPSCLRKFRHPAPWWVYVLGACLIVAAGLAGASLVRPQLAARLFVFVPSALSGWLLLMIPFSDMYPEYLSITDDDGKDFCAHFHHVAYACKFAELNQDIVFQVERAAWDVSIDIFPKQDE